MVLCSVKNQMRPRQSGMVAMRQLSAGTSPATDQVCSRVSQPSAPTRTRQISWSAVVGWARSWRSRKK